MPDPAFPYETRLNLLYQPLEVMDVNAVPDADKFKWFNQTLCRVNDSVVRMGALEGEYTGISTMKRTSSSTWFRASC